MNDRVLSGPDGPIADQHFRLLDSREAEYDHHGRLNCPHCSGGMIEMVYDVKGWQSVPIVDFDKKNETLMVDWDSSDDGIDEKELERIACSACGTEVHFTYVDEEWEKPKHPLEFTWGLRCTCHPGDECHPSNHTWVVVERMANGQLKEYE